MKVGKFIKSVLNGHLFPAQESGQSSAHDPCFWIKFFIANIYLKWRKNHINICSCCYAVFFRVFGFCGQCAFSQVIIAGLFSTPLLKRQIDDAIFWPQVILLLIFLDLFLKNTSAFTGSAQIMRGEDGKLGAS